MPAYPTEDVDYGGLADSLGLPIVKILDPADALVGERLFEAVTDRIASAFGARMSFISEVLLADKARVVAGHCAGALVQPFEYQLAGTPCGETLSLGATMAFDDLPEAFRTADWLPDIAPEAYFGTPLRSTSGDVIGLLVVVHDSVLPQSEGIAAILEAVAPRLGAELERHQRESTLHRSEALLRRLVEHCRDILFDYEMQSGTFEYISPAVEAITGYPPEAFQANPELSLQIIYDEDRPRVNAAILAGSSDPIAARIHTRSGETRWIEYRNYAFRDDDNQIRAICGTIRDSSSRIEALEALQISEHYRRALLSAMPDTVFRLDSDGVLLDYVAGDVSRAPADIAQDLTGRSIRDLLPPEFYTSLLKLTQAALHSNSLQRTEFDVVSEGQPMTYEARCLPFGRREVLIFLRDFTAIKWHQAEDERRRVRDEIDDKVERRRTNLYMLTYRELAVLHLVAEGQADKQIAESLGISTYTVNKHVGSILSKMNAASRTEAVVRAMREGLVG